MSSPRVIETQTEAFVRDLGRILRASRTARGYSLKNVAARMGRSDGLASDACQLERGRVRNPSINSAVRHLAVYGYTLAIVPVIDSSAWTLTKSDDLAQARQAVTVASEESHQ